MRKNKKWTIEDMEAIKQLRKDGRTWLSIARKYKTNRPNIKSVYKYYAPALDNKASKVEDAIKAIITDPILGTLGLGERRIKMIVDKVIEVYEA